MATSDGVSGGVGSFGESNKFQSKMNLFRKVIEGKKSEVRRLSQEMRSLIEVKEKSTIQELDDIWKEVNDRMELKRTEIQESLENIVNIKQGMDDKFKKLSPNISPLNISEIMNSVKRGMDIDIPNVNLTWRVNELEDCINRMCRCEQQILAYKEDTRFQLKWSKCRKGSGENQLYYPWCVATNPLNGTIYVADRGNHRIQIFSKEGEWIMSVKDAEMKKPENILFNNKSFYILCNKAILKLNESTKEREMYISFDFLLEGICKDNTHIYVGKYNGMNLIMLTLDLVEETRILLRTEFCDQSTEIRDISFSQDSFYVLLSETEHPIQVFSREGILTRSVVKKDDINDAYCFCLDQQLNILVADCGDAKVKIFSSEGKTLAEFGEKGTGKGQFYCLYGISVNWDGSILTVDQKDNHKLQLFSVC